MSTGAFITQTVLAYFGLGSQTLATLLLVVLFALLSRQAVRRPYFLAWRDAWLALSGALLALVLRYNVLPEFLGAGSDRDLWVRACYALYQLGKFAFLLQLLRGTLIYLRGNRRRGDMRLHYLWLAAVLGAIVTVAVSPGVQAAMFWQALVNLAAYAWCAAVLLTLPVERRSLGTRVTSTVLAATFALWFFYALALAHFALPQAQFGSGLLRLISGVNTYIDLIFDMLLAFGMVLVLFEDVRRELDGANRELRVAHERLLRESLLDPLTLAYNRRAFNEGVGLEDARGTFGTLAVFDLDNLKDVNDAHGHKCGDELLRHFVAVLRTGLRPSDKIYRLGGDEFLVVMPRTAAAAVEPRIRRLLAEAPPLATGECGKRIPLSASIGVADFACIGGLEQALAQADRCMYENKRASKREAQAGPETGSLPEQG